MITNFARLLVRREARIFQNNTDYCNFFFFCCLSELEGKIIAKDFSHFSHRTYRNKAVTDQEVSFLKARALT